MELPRFGPDATADEVAAAVRSHGAAAVEGFVPPEEVAALKAELAPHPRGDAARVATTSRGSATRRVYALFAKVRGFDRLAIDPLVLGVLDRILGPHYQLSGPVGIDIGPGESPQGLHQDDVVYPLPFPHPPVVLNTMWALDDFTEENGATRVVLGSHDTSSQDRPDRVDRGDGDDAGRLGALLRRHGVARGRRQPHRRTPPRGDPRVRRVVAAGPGDPPARRAARGRPHPAAPAAGAARLQHLPAVPRLRRRPPPPQDPEQRITTAGNGSCWSSKADSAASTFAISGLPSGSSGVERREAGREEQVVALAERDLERTGQPHDHRAARLGPPRLDEAHVPRRRPGVPGEVELALARRTPRQYRSRSPSSTVAIATGMGRTLRVQRAPRPSLGGNRRARRRWPTLDECNSPSTPPPPPPQRSRSILEGIAADIGFVTGSTQ